MNKEYYVWKYTYIKGEMRKEKYLAKEIDDTYVEFFASDENKSPNGSRKRIEIMEINNPCTNNLNQGVYLTEEDDDSAIGHFQNCFEERIHQNESQIEKWREDIKFLNSLVGKGI